jgi:predicted acylesterase/phospholipase RssA
MQKKAFTLVALGEPRSDQSGRLALLGGTAMLSKTLSANALCTGFFAVSAVAWAQQSGEEDLIFDFRPRIRLEASTEPSRQPGAETGRDIRVEIYRQSSNSVRCGPGERVYLDRAQVGVAFSGGISKGLAFIGALAFLDKAGVKVDGIVGTSMGAVIASFYASGYSPDAIYTPRLSEKSAREVEKIDSDFGRTFQIAKAMFSEKSKRGIVDEIDWNTLFTDLPPMWVMSFNQQNMWGLSEGNNFVPRIYQGGLRSGQNVYAFLSNYLLAASAASNGCFDDLYVPFRAVASDISNASPHTFRDGYLANAVRASLSFPVMFTPVFIGGKRYRDGGLLRNYPLTSIDEIRNKRFSVVLGFDVSDTSVSELERAPFFPILSLKDVVGGVLDEGLGAAITRETVNSLKWRPACKEVGDTGCLLDTKIPFKGGFTDFTEAKVEDFYWKGYFAAQEKLCKFFNTHSSCPPETLKAAIIEAKRTELLLPDKTISGDVLKKIAGSTGIAERLNRMLNDLSAASWERRDKLRDARSGTLQGMVVVSTRRETVVYADDGAPRELLVELQGLVRWLARGLELGEPERAASPLSSLSSVKIFVRGDDEIRVEAASWKYVFRKFGFYTDFTESARPTEWKRDPLENATLIRWNHGSSETADSPALQRKELPGEKCRDPDAKDPQVISWSRDKCPRLDKEPSSRAWLQKIYESLETEGKRSDDPLRFLPNRVNKSEPYDVRYTRADTLPAVLEELASSHYALGNTEYVRVDDIRRDELLMSEKSNNTHPGGTVYLDYQYDYIDKHTYIAKHSKYYRATTLHQLTNVAVNDPTGGPSGMRYIDTTLTYFNSDTRWIPRDVSLNVYSAHRTYRIARDPSLSRLDFNTWGAKLIAAGPADPTARERYSSNGSFYQIDYRSIKSVTSNDLQTVSGVLHDPTLSDPKRDKVSYHFGQRLYALGSFEPLMIRYSLHTPSGSSSFKEIYIEENLKLRVPNVSVNIRAGAIGQRIAPGGVTSDSQPPFEELYSVGGYYPLLEDRFWGVKRFDYIGAQMNQRWGTRVFLTSVRIPIPGLELDGLRILNPKTKLNIEVVYDFAYLGFPEDSSRKSRSAFGLSANAYVPMLSTLQPKINIALGGENANSIKLFASVDIVF